LAKIIIDIGHDLHDPGAVANNTTEHNEARAIVFAAAEKLQKIGAPFVIVPENLNLQNKIFWTNANATQNDFLISVHLNAAANFEASGTSVYFCDGENGAQSFAQTLAEKFSEILKIPNRGARGDTTTRHGRLGIIRDTAPHAFLVEMGFLTNFGDLQAARNFGGMALACAILKFFSFQNPFLPREAAWAFTDVDFQNWAFDLIMEAKNKGILGGFSDGSFRPKKSISRAEILAIFRKMNLV